MTVRAGGGQQVTVADFVETGREDLHLEPVAGQTGLRKLIREAAINRPGLALAGFFRYFATKRIQVFGFAENAYLESLQEEDRVLRLRDFFSKNIPCLMVARHQRVFPCMAALADEFRVPLFRTPMITKDFVNAATLIMENLVAPRLTVQGTMVEIMGIGVLIEGKPGLGKSETALSLIRRGAALVSDDVTALRLDSAGHLIATPFNVTRYHMEIRGVGIVHVPSLFGVASVREEKKVDMIASLCEPCEMEGLDRSGQTRPVRTVLGVDVPVCCLAVAPGREMANIIETAALDMKLRRLGHDAAKELDEKLMALMSRGKAASE